MPDRTTLDPELRTVYSASLHPPAGYALDSGIATTYSLDLETALTVPVSLALFAAENRDEILAHHLALLEAAERIAGRLLIFTDAGHIHAQTSQNSRLCSLLERVVIEVAAPNGGAFHPKIWALRFKPLHPGDPVHLRLLVLSRNLTRDRSWDIAATLDGVVGGKPDVLNRPIVDLIRNLPRLAIYDVPEETASLVDSLAEDMRRAEWSLPEPFEHVSFAVNGVGDSPWRFDDCARLGIISPFCDDKTLSMLARHAKKEKPYMIGRSDELSRISESTLEKFDRVEVLDEMAETEYGEDSDKTALRGLHAKIFIAERGWDTAITVGSGNATQPALATGKNVEFFVTLTGKRSRVGSIEDILGAKGFGRLTCPFFPSEQDREKNEAEEKLEAARHKIILSGLKLSCKQAGASRNGPPLWQVSLVSPKPLPLSKQVIVEVWPITRGANHACEVQEALRHGQKVSLGDMSLADITRFLAFRLKDVEQNVSILFSTRLAMDGLPEARDTAILRKVIGTQEAFLRYLRLLLAELGNPIAAASAARGGFGHSQQRVMDDDVPILEEMVRAFCEGSDQISGIKRLVERLEADDGEGNGLIPEKFRELWNAFQDALAKGDAWHAE